MLHRIINLLHEITVQLQLYLQLQQESLYYLALSLSS